MGGLDKWKLSEGVDKIDITYRNIDLILLQRIHLEDEFPLDFFEFGIEEFGGSIDRIIVRIETKIFFW